MPAFKVADVNELEQIFRSVHDVWPHDPDPVIHTQLRLASEKHKAALWIIGKQEHQIVCSLGLFPLKMMLNGEIASAYSIGAVYTPVSHRRCGYASSLLNFSIELMEEQQRHIGVLYSDISPAFYQKHGFCHLNSSAFVYEVSGRSSYSHRKEILVSEAIWSVSCKLIQRLYKQWAASHDGAPYRDQNHWDWHIKRYPEARYFLLRQGRIDIGYIAATVANDKLVILDFASSNQIDVESVLAQVLSLSKGFSTITGWWPMNQEFSPDISIVSRKDEMPMIRGGGDVTGKRIAFQQADHV